MDEQPETGAGATQGLTQETKPARTLRQGKPKLAEGQRRVQISVRVLPKTLADLTSLQEPNIGRAIDKVVLLARHSKLIGESAIPVTLI